MDIDVRPEVVHRLLDIMRKLLADLVELGHPTAEELTQDQAARFTADRVLSALADLAVAINTHLGAVTGAQSAEGRAATFDVVVELGAVDAHLATALRDFVPLRDEIADTAHGVDRARLAAAVPQARTQFAAYAAAIAAWVDARSGAPGT